MLLSMPTHLYDAQIAALTRNKQVPREIPAHKPRPMTYTAHPAPISSCVAQTAPRTYPALDTRQDVFGNLPPDMRVRPVTAERAGCPARMAASQANDIRRTGAQQHIRELQQFYFDIIDLRRLLNGADLRKEEKQALAAYLFCRDFATREPDISDATPSLATCYEAAFRLRQELGAIGMEAQQEHALEAFLFVENRVAQRAAYDFGNFEINIAGWKAMERSTENRHLLLGGRKIGSDSAFFTRCLEDAEHRIRMARVTWEPTLDLSALWLRGLPDVSETLKRLECISLKNNDVHQIPSCLARLPHLVQLDLSFNPNLSIPKNMKFRNKAIQVNLEKTPYQNAKLPYNARSLNLERRFDSTT